jgi:hypothetical protein
MRLMLQFIWQVRKEMLMSVRREEFTPQGTMVIDAFDSVTFDDVSGGMFEDSLADDLVGDRLEVVSRITEWLFQAVGRLPFADSASAMSMLWYGNPDSYVLRGAGLDSGITDGRAWVLENPIEPAPLYTETGEKTEEQTLGVAGCPALLAAAAEELGIAEETIEVSLANSFALNTDIQPCDTCARLVNAAQILRDVDGTRMAAMVEVFNTLAPSDAHWLRPMHRLHQKWQHRLLWHSKVLLKGLCMPRRWSILMRSFNM